MDWNSGFCKQRKCNYIITDEDCEMHLQWENAGIANIDTYRDRKGQTGKTQTKKERQGQTGTEGDHQGRKGLSLLGPVSPFMSLPCPCLSNVFPACPSPVPGVDCQNWLIAEYVVNQ